MSVTWLPGLRYGGANRAGPFANTTSSGTADAAASSQPASGDSGSVTRPHQTRRQPLTAPAASSTGTNHSQAQRCSPSGATAR
jgi:hypothetical protein